MIKVDLLNLYANTLALAVDSKIHREHDLKAGGLRLLALHQAGASCCFTLLYWQETDV